MNSITVCGRMTRDPELRKVGEKQTSVCNFGIADNYFNQGEQTNFWDCVAWGGLAENLVKFCKKGSQLTLVGEVQTEKWTTKEGDERKGVKLVVRNVEFGAKANGNGGGDKGGEATTENPGVSVDSEIPW